MSSAIGKKWTDVEEEKLLAEVKSGTPIDKIASSHQRNIGGIKCRLYMIALRMTQNKEKNLEDVCKDLRISVEAVENYKNRQIESVGSKRQSVNETELDILKQIRDILVRLESKLT